MSKLRGQLRFFLIIAVGVLTVYVFYNYFGSSGSVKTRTAKDSAVLKYHQLAGQVDAGKQFQNQDVHGQHTVVNVQQNRPPVDIQENPPLDLDSQENHPHLHNPDELSRQGPDGNHEIDLMDKSDWDNQALPTDDDNSPRHSDDDTQQQQQENGGRKKFSPFATEVSEEEFDLYTEKDPNFFSFFEKQLRLVHLDLKGAAPKLSYFEKVIPLFNEMGATGLLIEYEDMFPYDDHLSTLAAKNAYSKEDISKINAMASAKGMTVIPLIPTFGHMEFVLKGNTYQNLREEDHTPQVISPTMNSRLVIKAMIDQVQKLHPDSKFIHIGCDEVYRLGEGYSKRLLEENGWTAEDLFFNHVTAIAKMVKDLGVQPIMWDDMFRKLDEGVIKKSGIGNLVQPMVWQYVQQPQAQLPEDIWSKYGRVFGNVWVASSFKGATGSSQYITDVTYHLENHLNWVEIMKFYGNSKRKSVNFMGVALTGWQRYDHFATLCELLPVAIPSLAVCLQTLRDGYFDRSLHEKIARNLLQCQDLVELRFLPKADKTSACEFPGNKIYYEVQELYELKKEKVEGYRVSHRLTGWMSSYNVKHNFSSPGQLAVLKKNVDPILKSLLDLRNRMEKSLLEVFDLYTTAEFLEVQIDSVVERLNRELKLALSLAKRRVWPRRPVIGSEQGDSSDTLNINNADQNQAGGRINVVDDKAVPVQQNQQQPGGDGQSVRQQAGNEGSNRKNDIPSNQFVNNAVPNGGLMANPVFKQPGEDIHVPPQGHQFPVQGIKQGSVQQLSPIQAKQMKLPDQQLQGREQFVQNKQVLRPGYQFQPQGTVPVRDHQLPVQQLPFANPKSEDKQQFQQENLNLHVDHQLKNGHLEPGDEQRRKELGRLQENPHQFESKKRQPGNIEVKDIRDKDGNPLNTDYKNHIEQHQMEEQGKR